MFHNLDSNKKVFIEMPVTRSCKQENEIALRHFSHRGWFCSVVFLVATSCGDIQHHRQVSVLQNIHQPLRLLLGPEEVEVQPVLSGQ